MRIRLLLLMMILSACSANSAPKAAPTTGEFSIRAGIRQGSILGLHWVGESDLPASGHDAIGNYIQLTIHLQSQGVPLTESIRQYSNRPVALFSVTYEAAASHPVVFFPDFDQLPTNSHVMSYRDRVFSPPAFDAMDSGSPWLIFDDYGNSFIISPASHYLIQSIGGDAKSHITSQLHSTVTNIPAGFTQRTLVAMGKGINRTWNEWGHALTDLEGKKRPANDADTGLKYLGYWTDNGTHYYYNFDPNLGYGGTLLAVAKHFRDENIPVKYFQLDSWWYYKTFTGPDGKTGKAKNAKLPAGEWNRYGGLLEYRAHPGVFPQGLEAFQKELGLPLITHNRWVDPASPYHQKYQISGYAAVDPGYWNDIMSYISGANVQTYEQDWLIDIYNHSPELKSTINAGDEFTDGMAHAAADRKMTVQYCMALPGFFMEGAKYPNLTTIRCSDDRFNPDRWYNFLFTSRLASSLGIWPWTDPYMTWETGNILISTLSAGMVGFGDPMGKENTTNIFRAVRADGVIVKPDVPLVPIDASYIAEANHQHKAIVASTYSDHNGIRTKYVFAFRPTSPRRTSKTAATKDSEAETPATQPSIIESRFSLADIDAPRPAYVYDFLTQQVQLIDSNEDIVSPLGQDGFNYFIIASPGTSGIAFFGDADKFASNGSQRIASIKESPRNLNVQVTFAQGENNVRIHGCSPTPIKARVGFHLLNTAYDRFSGHFYIDADAKWLAGQSVAPDGTRTMDINIIAE